MNAIFGVPIVTLMTVLLVMLAVCLLSVAWVAWRRPVIFKLGVRNIPRRKAQTVLIVVGLMLSTLIITGALGTGDTLNYSATAATYDGLGHIDELVVQSQDAEGDVTTALGEKIDGSALTIVETTLAGDPNVDGVMPLLEERVPVLNETKRQGEPTVVLTGVDPSRLAAFGGLTAEDGTAIDLAALAPDQVVLSARAAETLDAAPGDSLTAYYENQPVALSVAAIAENGYLSGVRRDDQGLEVAGMVMPLARLQEFTKQPNALSAVVVSNAGNERSGLAKTDAVVAKLVPALAGTRLGVDRYKQDQVGLAAEQGALFTNVFLVLGLFSIAAGILLIVLIFTMLAAERRPEMGMARAVGTQRGQLVQQFVAEGASYAVLAGLIGAALGVAAAIGIASAMKFLFGQYLPIEPHVEPRSLVVAYCLGVVITFLAVVGSSWKISRLNVVAAVRDIPEVSRSHRSKRSLVWGALLLAGGALLIAQGLSSDTAAVFFAGMSLAPFGLALIVRFAGVPGRPIFSLAGLYLLILWLLPENVQTKLFGKLDGDIEMFFFSGIFMVVGATILIIQNTDLLLAGVARLGGLFRSKLPAVRTAVAYPGAARGRTGLTVAMFSLIIFSLVMMATMTGNYDNLFLGDDANAGWDVRADALATNPVADFERALRTQGVDTSGFAAVGTVSSAGATDLRLVGAQDQDWKPYAARGMSDGFLSGSTLKFQARATGYESDAAIVEALKTQPNVAVIDSLAIPRTGFGSGGAPERFELTGLERDAEVFDPIRVEVATPDGGTVPVTVIGVIDGKLSSLVGLFGHERTMAAAQPAETATSYYVALNDPERADAVAKEIEAALLPNGVQGTSIRDELAESQKQSSGFLYLIEGFMGLGLFVGVAAVGVIAFRSVVERRQQIGVLRAIGFQRGLVSLSFLIETAFVVGLGVLAGTILGVILARNLFTSDDAVSGAAFTVPWSLIAVILLATVVVALLMTWLPSRQAARISPAEALRYE